MEKINIEGAENKLRLFISKENGILKIKDGGGGESRHETTIETIKEANKLYQWKDFKEIRIFTGDFEFENCLEYTYSNRKELYNYTIPCFSFGSWPEAGITNYTETTQLIHNAGLQKFEINKVGWIGSLLIDSRYILHSMGAQYHELFDFQIINWKSNGKGNFNGYDNYISLPDLVKKYSLLIDIEGNGFSARLKFLLWSHRPVLLIERPHKEFFYQYLNPWEHYIPVQRDMSDLIEKTQWCLNNYDKALIIAENAYKFSQKYLTKEAAYIKWDSIIQNIT